MTDPTLLRRAEAVRRFNRFYTQHIGVLHERLQKSPFSLTEVRVLRELALGTVSTATDLARVLGLDTGYLSRLLTSFERRQLITRRQSEIDARQSLLEMTGVGQAAYAPLEVAAIDEVCTVLGRLSETGQQLLIEAMHVIERLLTEDGAQSGFTLRAPRAGDYGWLMHRQSMLFANAYGADAAFEAFVAEEIGELARERDRERAMCWIAEQSQAIIGGAFVAPIGERTAKLRLLYVEPEVRRIGVGTQLVAEGVRFAQRAGYLTLTLSTYGVVNEGSGIFERAGFVCRSSATERRFGRPLLEQNWERRLDA